MRNIPRHITQHRRGQQWILDQLKYVLRHSLAELTPYVSWRQPSENWWRLGPRGDVLYFRLEGDVESKALAFPQAAMEACGAGDYHERQRATNHIVERLGAMSLL
jgi:hypothetical protein